MLDRHGYNCSRNLSRDSILGDGLASRNGSERFLAASLVETFEAIEAVAAVSELLTSATDAAYARSELEQRDLRFDVVVFGHGSLRGSTTPSSRVPSTIPHDS